VKMFETNGGCHTWSIKCPVSSMMTEQATATVTLCVVFARENQEKGPPRGGAAASGEAVSRFLSAGTGVTLSGRIGSILPWS
jgi:hypothetical protein